MNRKYAGRIALSMLVLTAAVVAVDALVDHMTDPPKKLDSTETISLTEEITMPWRMGADEKYVLERYSELTEEAAADHVILTDKNYGGMYYDDDGYAVICVKTDSPSDTYADIIDVGDGMNQIAIREVKYSKAELEAVREDIRGFAPHLGDYLIIELRIRDTENKIQVGLPNATTSNISPSCFSPSSGSTTRRAICSISSSPTLTICHILPRYPVHKISVRSTPDAD